jgi:hypothetical protein
VVWVYTANVYKNSQSISNSCTLECKNIRLVLETHNIVFIDFISLSHSMVIRKILSLPQSISKKMVNYIMHTKNYYSQLYKLKLQINSCVKLYVIYGRPRFVQRESHSMCQVHQVNTNANNHAPRLMTCYILKYDTHPSVATVQKYPTA